MHLGTVLNTRPISHASRTSGAFKELGFTVLEFPCIEIAQSDDTQYCQKLISKIHPKSIILFTSPQSVIYAFKITPNWLIPSSAFVIAMGLKTAQYLEQHTSVNVFVPEQQNSHGVIDLLNGLKSIHSISLISAKNGRNKIQEYAKENKIELSQINVYQRKLPSTNLQLDWLNNCSDEYLKFGILATSISTLNNLKLLVCHNHWLKLKHQLFICASSRIQKHAQSLDCKITINTRSANPKVMAKILKDYLSSH